MNFEEVILNAKDGYPLSLRIFNCAEPKAVISIIHGMEEHQGRYVDFASFLCENGFTVVTSDLRGHGKNAIKLSHIADKNGHELLIQDQKDIADYIDNRFPTLPKYLFGHSMGTIIARNLIETDSLRFDKLVLTGYPCYNGAAGFGCFISSFLRMLKGPDQYSKLLTALSLGAYAKSIPNRKTNLDWISYSEENIIAYDKDPLSGEEFTIASYNALFHLVKDLNSIKKCQNINKDLSILLVAGADDPCAGGEKGRASSLKILQKQGFTKIEAKTYENMRHEVLNELEHQKVYQLILNFFNKK